MTVITFPGADVRGFYRRLGIVLPDSPSLNVSVRCFADPDAHQHADRAPSCSVNTQTGAWKCHGCGASGGAFDAALARHHDSRSAMDLLIDYHLAERRTRLQPASALVSQRPVRPAPVRWPHTAAHSTSHPIGNDSLAITEDDVRRWQQRLAHHPNLLARLQHTRAWRHDTIRALGLGYDRGRITIPVRTGSGRLRGLLRYQPEPTGRPKMLAVAGSRLGLVPHPAAEASEHVLLVEGPPDMIAARSAGASAIAVPGDHAWQPDWAELLTGRHVTIVMDCDPPGRAAAARIAGDLRHVGTVEILDLAPARTDGYDLTDWLLAGGEVFCNQHPHKGGAA